jgi:hypothetical protein
MNLKSRIIIGALAILSVGVLTTSCDELLGLTEDFGVTDAEVVAGLRDALSHGTDTAVSRLSLTDGYFKDELVKILLPAEAQPIYSRLQAVPILNTYLDETVLSINRAAEDAATEAKPIFKDAIRNLTIQDGWNILQGEDTAATSYLRKNTYSDLVEAFQPKIEQSLSKDLVLGMSAEESYTRLINTYNTASLNGFLYSEIQENSLSEHTTRKALSGLFTKVSREEKMIREDPAHRVTDILKKVFAEQDNP